MRRGSTYRVSIIGCLLVAKVRPSLPTRECQHTALRNPRRFSGDSPDKVALQSGAYNAVEPRLVRRSLALCHTELLEDDGLVRLRLRGGVVSDPLGSPGGAARVRALAPAFWVQLQDSMNVCYIWRI